MSTQFHKSPVFATETARIADQLKRVYEGPAWLGPSLKEILSDVREGAAAARSIHSAHTIWELVLHIAAWMKIARERLSATETRDHTEQENWPPVMGSWEDALKTLDNEQHELKRAILAFPDHRLHETAPASETQSFYVLLHGVIQHTAYHAGQIVFLKKK